MKITMSISELYLKNMSTIRTVWSSLSQSISSIHFQARLKEQLDIRNVAISIRNHFFMSVSH